jgi:hypothetical protein
MNRQRIRRWSLDTAIRMCEKGIADLERPTWVSLPRELVRSTVAGVMVRLTPRVKP